MTRYPEGKTPAMLKIDVHQSELKKGDYGYIDGYASGGDGRPYAVFVRDDDGVIDLVPFQSIKALFNEE